MYEFVYKEMYLVEDTHFWYKSLHEIIEYYVKEEYNKSNKNLDIIDVGCGTGKLLTILNKYGNAKGIDYSSKAIDYCKERGLKNVEVNDINEYKFEESAFDLITCIDVLYHSGIEDDIKILKNFYSSLKDNGMLILDLPAFNILWRKHDTAVSGKRRYTRNKLVPELQKIGFKIETQSYRLSFLFLPVLLMKYLEKLRKDDQIKSDLKQPPFFLNWLILQKCRVENQIIKYLNLPFGTSLFITARK